MARTGLRMMPTFPSPPLRFRTAGFPRYGSKASLSDGVCLSPLAVKRAPRMPARSGSLLRPSPVSAAERTPGSASRLVPASAGRCARGPASLPQGSLAPVRVMLSRSLIAYYDPIRQSRGHAATSRPCRLYATPSLCGSAEATRETFPTFAAVLSPCAVNPTPAGPRRPPVVYWRRNTRLPRIMSESSPTSTRLCQQYPTGVTFRRCIVRVMLRPTRLPSPPDWLRPDAVTCSAPCLLRYLVAPAFDVVRRRATLGVRLDGRTGNLPSSGLSPDKFTAAE
jgi:hypothetical protein